MEHTAFTPRGLHLRLQDTVQKLKSILSCQSTTLNVKEVRKRKLKCLLVLLHHISL